MSTTHTKQKKSYIVFCGNQGKEIKALLNIFHNDLESSTKNHEEQTFKNPEIETNRKKVANL